jgi:hypothetical protein
MGEIFTVAILKSYIGNLYQPMYLLPENRKHLSYPEVWIYYYHFGQINNDRGNYVAKDIYKQKRNTYVPQVL